MTRNRENKILWLVESYGRSRIPCGSPMEPAYYWQDMLTESEKLSSQLATHLHVALNSLVGHTSMRKWKSFWVCAARVIFRKNWRRCMLFMFLYCSKSKEKLVLVQVSYHESNAGLQESRTDFAGNVPAKGSDSVRFVGSAWKRSKLRGNYYVSILRSLTPWQKDKIEY